MSEALISGAECADINESTLQKLCFTAENLRVI